MPIRKCVTDCDRIASKRINQYFILNFLAYFGWSFIPKLVNGFQGLMNHSLFPFIHYPYFDGIEVFYHMLRLSNV